LSARLSRPSWPRDWRCRNGSIQMSDSCWAR
jgi:hypothetical protein